MDINSTNRLIVYCFSPPCVDFHSYLHHGHIHIATAKKTYFSICTFSILQLLYFGNKYINGADVDQDEDISPKCFYIFTLADSLWMKIYLSDLVFNFYYSNVNFFRLYSIVPRCAYGNCSGEAGHLFAPISKALCVQSLLRIYLSRWYDNPLLVPGERAMLE